MKIAVIIGGPYRGNSEIIARQTTFFGNKDTYLSCFEHYKYEWIKSSWPIKKIFTTPNINFKDTNWSRYRNDEPGQSGFWQFWNLKNVINNIEEDYDFYIKTRSDLILPFEKLPEDFLLNLKPNTFYCPATRFDNQPWEYGYSLNDQIFIGDSNVMRVVSNFVTKYYNTFRHTLNEATEYVGSNETSLRKWLDENGISIVAINSFTYTKNHNGNTLPSGVVGIYQLETIL
jgi:hypothetical protein